ncbi:MULTISPECIES: hypothetical protein [Actinomycetes]|uniref:hypothetical protein n=1 Tax=Tessaracoccus caeni TaxID=3031239 RepID=UPI000AC4C221|nr:hypothetical protein [Tessaracoccus caeni]MDF1489757.1 hypothetical protein [Tessaracoccus caeni]
MRSGGHHFVPPERADRGGMPGRMSCPGFGSVVRTSRGRGHLLLDIQQADGQTILV